MSDVHPPPLGHRDTGWASKSQILMAKQLARSAAGVQGVGHRISGWKLQPLMPRRLMAIHPVSKTGDRGHNGWHPRKSAFSGVPQAGFATHTGWLCVTALILLLIGTGRLTGVITDPARPLPVQANSPDDSPHPVSQQS